jgi:hypothetical protein
VSDHFNEYHLQHHFEGRRRQLVEEAQQERLKAEVVKAARQQKQSRPAMIRLPNLLMRLRTVLRTESPQPKRAPLESTTP